MRRTTLHQSPEPWVDQAEDAASQAGLALAPAVEAIAAQAAAAWSRSAMDPEAARRRSEYLEAKARKRAAISREETTGKVHADTESARATVLEKLRQEGAA